MAASMYYAVKKHSQSALICSETIDTSFNSSDDSLQRLADEMKIKVISLTDEEIVFDLIGVDAALANSLRRILLAEVPTVAIETVYIIDNTSVIQDEVLSHRLGLIPLAVDPSKLQFKTDEDGSTEDTLVYRLEVECMLSADGKSAVNQKVYSDQLQWSPQPNQEEIVGTADPVHKDILIAELRPGQRICLEAHAVKGIGKDHTKFSPVATASYRLLPDISFAQPVEGDLAYELKNMCPLQVFDIEDIQGIPTATVGRPRDCTMCRECIRKEGWEEGRVELKRKANHFIFTVESVGILKPEVIVREAISILKKKAVRFYKLAEEYETGL